MLIENDRILNIRMCQIYGEIKNMKTIKEQSHRLLSIHILEILNKYTDRKHTMSQAELMQKLEDEYGEKISRHTCSDYLKEIRLAGYIKGARGVYTPFRFSKEEIN